MVRIPSIAEYYLHEGKLVLRSRWNKRFKIGLMIGIVLGSLIPSVAPSYTNASLSRLKYTTKEAVFAEYIIKENPSVKKTEATKIALSATKWAAKFDIDPKMVIAIMKQESNFNRDAVSNAGALGLMQVMVQHHVDKLRQAKVVLSTPEMFGIETSIYLGTWVFKQCLDKNRLDNTALKCYNGSLKMKTDYDTKVLSHYQKISKLVKDVI